MGHTVAFDDEELVDDGVELVQADFEEVYSPLKRTASHTSGRAFWERADQPCSLYRLSSIGRPSAW